jgi:hypothetical protein
MAKIRHSLRNRLQRPSMDFEIDGTCAGRPQHPEPGTSRGSPADPDLEYARGLRAELQDEP